MGAQAEYTEVDAVLHPATLDPTYFNVYHEQRPNAPYLIVAYTPYAPFTLISSVLVNGDNLLSTIDITGGTDDWHEYWYMIPTGSFTGGVIPAGEHTYTITVQTTDGTTRQYSNTPNIDPLDWVTQVAPDEWATVSTTPTFQWNSVTDAVRYRLELFDQTGYWVYHGYIDAPTITHTIPAGRIFAGRTYRWRMTAYGPTGTDGTYDNRSRSVWRNFTVAPETVTISGQILDHNGSPLQGVKVEALLGGNVIVSTFTDAGGGYDLSVPEGYQYTIRVTAAGYARVSEETAGVVSGDLQDFDLGFTPADVDNSVPSIANLDPPDGSTVSTGQPEISAILSDDHAGIDPETIVFTLDGTPVDFSYSEIDGRVSFTPIANLANGSHTVTVDALDYAQNPATQAAWSFTVDVQLTGDLNCDLNIDLADAIIAVQVLIDNPPQTFCFSDVDGDGKTGLAEALYALQKVAGFRDYEITYTYLQYRRYGDGSERRQIWIELKDLAGNPSGDVLNYAEIKDPNGQLVEIYSAGFEPSVDYVARYNSETGGWDEDLYGKPAAGYWGRLNTTFLQPGNYTFTVVTKDGESLAPYTYYFSGEYPGLPVVDSSTINWSWNGDGSLTINWTLPTQAVPPNLDPAEWHADVYIDVIQGGSDTGHHYFGKVPLDLTPQHVDLSPAMVAKLQSLGDELRCWLRIRKNDNSYRSYSNRIIIWP